MFLVYTYHTYIYIYMIVVVLQCLTYNYNRTCATQCVNHVACICNVDVRNPMHVVCWTATVLHLAVDDRYVYTDMYISNRSPHIVNSCTFICIGLCARHLCRCALYVYDVRYVCIIIHT